MITRLVSNVRYSCVWMQEEQIVREFVSPHKSCWVVSLECTIKGKVWGCYQCIDDLKREPKVKKAFFMAMRRKHKALSGSSCPIT